MPDTEDLSAVAETPAVEASQVNETKNREEYLRTIAGKSSVFRAMQLNDSALWGSGNVWSPESDTSEQPGLAPLELSREQEELLVELHQMLQSAGLSPADCEAGQSMPAS